MEVSIVPFEAEKISAVLKFTDRAIGDNYYQRSDLVKFTELGHSYLLENAETGDILGVRLTLPPGTWVGREKLKGLHPHLWDVDPEKVAYFKSIFLADEVRGQNFGLELSRVAMAGLKGDGALAVVCHSWNESPNDSSGRYLRKLGFKDLVVIENFWGDIDYSCTRCGNPCKCSATEMICRL